MLNNIIARLRLAEIAIETFSLLHFMHCIQFAVFMFVCLSRISRAMIGRHKISVQIFKSNDSMTQNMLSSDWLQNFQYNQAYLLCLFLLIEVSFFGMRAGICSLNNTGLGLDLNLMSMSLQLVQALCVHQNCVASSILLSGLD